MDLLNRNKIKLLFALLVYFFASFPLWAQKQPNIPQPRGPVDLSETSNIIIFIVLPIIVLIGYLFWRSAMKKRKQAQEERDRKNNRGEKKL